MAESNVSQKIEIELLKKDVNMITKLCEKFDVTIDKMQQVASDISKIVSIQEQRLTNQEKINEEVDYILEKQKKEQDKQKDELNEKIKNVYVEMSNKIEKTEETILSEIKHLRENLKNMNDGLDKRVGQIEMWRYMIMGIIAFGVFLLSQIFNIIKLF